MLYNPIGQPAAVILKYNHSDIKDVKIMSNLKSFAVATVLLLLLSTASSSAVPEYAKPLDAYQKKYDMSFFVWKPLGLQSKWYATYDGYPVTEIAKNQWVYGITGNAGQLTESLIAVGSVDPNTVYILTPLSPFLKENQNEESYLADSLKSIFKTKCDNFGIAYTETTFTPIAWESGTLKVYMWGGKKWVPIFHRPGEKLSDTIKRDSYMVSRMLRKHKILWTPTDTFEFANYIRSAGYNWVENFATDIPLAFNEIGVKTGSGNDPGESESGKNNPDDGGWDTGRNWD